MADPLSPEDARQQRLTKAAAETMGQWFVESSLLRKPIGDMAMAELMGAATAAISGWQIALSRELLAGKEEDFRQSALI